MAGAGEDESDAVLSDVEAEDDPPPARLNEGDISPEKFRELLAELDRERQARTAAESKRAELENSFQRLKAVAHGAIKMRDECSRGRDDAIRERDEAARARDEMSRERDEAARERDEMARERDEAVREREEAVREREEARKAREGSRGEIEAAAQMLVTGIEKISGKVSHIRNFTNGGLPRSQKYTGMAAIAYGVIKRTNDIVEEMIKQVEAARRERDEAREQAEQRNYEVAIEVSELEASVGRLREEVGEKGGRVEELERLVAEKEGRLSEVERGMGERLGSVESERGELRRLAEEYEGRVRVLEAEMEAQRRLVVQQLGLVLKVHEQLCDVIKVVGVGGSDLSELSESLFVPQETGLEESIRASLAGTEAIFELSRVVVAKTKDVLEEKSREVKSLNETVARLFREKEHVGVLLRSALSKRLTSGGPGKTNEVFQVAENGLRESGIEYKFGSVLEDGRSSDSPSKEGSQGKKDDEIYSLAGALENIIKESQLQIIELQHAVEDLRAESSALKELLERQAKELSQRKNRIEELEEKERQANENIEGLMMDIAAAEEEITRWKVAAEQEAAAGRGIEQEYLAQISSIKQEVEEAKQAMIESEKKLKFKEETAAAAMAAREAAEKSLRLADIRASRLRDRVEELTHQLESLDKDENRTKNRARYACWPWEWLGIDFVGHRRIETPQEQSSNEMELSEPLL